MQKNLKIVELIFRFILSIIHCIDKAAQRLTLKRIV